MSADKRYAFIRLCFNRALHHFFNVLSSPIFSVVLFCSRHTLTIGENLNNIVAGVCVWWDSWNWYSAFIWNSVDWFNTWENNYVYETKKPVRNKMLSKYESNGFYGLIYHCVSSFSINKTIKFVYKKFPIEQIQPYNWPRKKTIFPYIKFTVCF